MDTNTNIIPRFPIFHWPVHRAYDPPHDPHRVHHVIGPVMSTLGALVSAGAALYYIFSITSGETASWATIATIIFFPIVAFGVFIVSFLLSRALGRYHAIGSLIGLAVGAGILMFWTSLWIGIFRSSPAEVLRSKAANVTSVSGCATLADDQAYWRDCMITHLKTEEDFSLCLSQSDRFVRHIDDQESATATCGVVYSHVTNDITACNRLLMITDRNVCSEEFSQPLNKSTDI